MTKQERQWLERRDKNKKEYSSLYCQHCKQFNSEWDLYLGYCNDSIDCPLTEHDFRDAAEFEARVALELTDYDASYRPPCPDNCRSIRNCRECHLMYARLSIEQEMDDADRS